MDAPNVAPNVVPRGNLSETVARLADVKPPPVGVRALLTDEFMQRRTPFGSLDEMLSVAAAESGWFDRYLADLKEAAGIKAPGGGTPLRS